MFRSKYLRSLHSGVSSAIGSDTTPWSYSPISQSVLSSLETNNCSALPNRRGSNWMTMLLKARMLTGKSSEAAKESTQTLHVYHIHNFPKVLHEYYMQQSDIQVKQLYCCRKFHDKKMSQALGNARPDRLADRKALLRIDTSILANASSVRLDTAQVCIRVYRSAPSLAASMSGSLTCSKSQTSTDKQSAQPKLLWQSANLTTDAKGIIIVDTECSAKATDAACEGQSRLAKLSLMRQVLQYVQQEAGVKLATKFAKVRAMNSCIIVPKLLRQRHMKSGSYCSNITSISLLACMQISVLSSENIVSKDPSASGRHEDLSQIPAATSSHLPASLLSKLSLVKPEDERTHKSSGDSLPTRASATEPAVPLTQAKKRPLIQEL